MTSLAPQVVRAVAGGVDGRFNNQATALPSYTPAPPPFNWKPLAAIAAALVLLAILIRNKE